MTSFNRSLHTDCVRMEQVAQAASFGASGAPAVWSVYGAVWSAGVKRLRHITLTFFLAVPWIQTRLNFWPRVGCSRARAGLPGASDGYFGSWTGLRAV